MRLVVLGATGRTGQQVTKQALAKSHSVTAIVRNTSFRNEAGSSLVVADPCNPEELLPVFADQDAVISCLGQRPNSGPRFVTEATVAALTAMRQAPVKRFVIVSGALLYPTWNPMALLLKRVMAVKLADGRAAEQAVFGSDLDWTIVRPPRLLEGTSKGYRIEVGERPNLTFGLTFCDLAACLVKLTEDGSYTRQVLGVASC